MSRLTAVVVALSLSTAAPASAQTADPIDLARGLRENGLPDLALEFLRDLEGKRPTPGALAVIPLERARAKLELAAEESDDAKRGALVGEAKADFDRFLAANATHPRRAEAALSLARLVSVQAKGQVSKANKRTDEKDRTRELLAARPVFDDAAKRFSQAAGEFAKKLDDANQAPAARRLVQNDLYQAQLDEAINKFQLATTYPTAGAAADDIVARGKAIDDASKLFTALGGRDLTHPLCWVAQAWAGECESEKASPVEAQKRFDAVKKEATRLPAVAGLGGRTARFFELRAEFQKVFADKNAAGLRKSQTSLEAWLAESAGRPGRVNPEVSAARFYLANAKIRLAEPLIKTDPKTQQVTLQGDARALLQSAERDLRRLLDPENDYTARAAEARVKLVRTLIGDPDKVELAKLADYETGLMVAQVQYYRAVKEADTDEARKLAAGKAVATYERLQRLPVPREFARDAAEAQANQAYAYTLAGKPFEAAVLAESIARGNRNAATASRAGLIAIAAYRQAGAAAGSDAKGRRVDLDRAVAVGLWLDKQFPLEANTDSARLQVGRELLQARRAPEAFALLARVPDGSPVVLDARYLESIAAVEVLRPAPAAEGVAGQTPAEKAAVFQKAIADLQVLPETPAAAPRGDARLAVLLALQLAELHFLNGAAELPKAEATAALAGKKLSTLTSLTPDDKQELGFRVELARMRALWGQSLGLFQAKKYAEAVAKIAPVLKEANDNGAVFKEGMDPEVAALAKRVDEYRREKLIGLALQARIREGAVGQVGELLDVLKKLGGSLANSGATLGVMIDGVRPQIDALRKEGKAAEADALAAGIGTILDKVAAEPDIKPPTIIVLAQGLNSIGNHDKAVEFLKKIAAPADLAMMKKKPNELPAEADLLAVLRYRNAQLEMARAYRLGKKYAEADAILKEAVGDGKPGSGWVNNADFRREVAYLLEAKAADDPDPKSAVKLWGEARAKWTEMANQYFVPLKNLSGGKNDPRLAMRALLDLNELPKNDKLPKKPADIRAALSANPPPKWLTDLTVESVKGPDGKPVEQPEAVAYVAEMRNTSKRLETMLKPLYHDLVFESLRCGVKANVSLLKANPAGLPAKLEAFAKQLVQLETGNPDMADEVKAKFAGLLDETPVLKEVYLKNSGKAFLKPAP